MRIYTSGYEFIKVASNNDNWMKMNEWKVKYTKTNVLELNLVLVSVKSVLHLGTKWSGTLWKEII